MHPIPMTELYDDYYEWDVWGDDDYSDEEI